MGERSKRERARPKPTDFGGLEERVNSTEVVAVKGQVAPRGHPLCGEGCGEALAGGIFVKDSSILATSTGRASSNLSLSGRSRSAVSLKVGSQVVD